MELFTTGKMSVKLCKLIEPRLNELTLDKIKVFRELLTRQGIEIPDAVMQYFDNIVSAKTIHMLRQHKVVPMFMFDALEKKKQEGKKVKTSIG